MTVSYFTHVRCLGDGSPESPYVSNLEFIPEVDALLLFINNRSACVDFNKNLVEENLTVNRWTNQIIFARNKHIAVIQTESEEWDFENQINSFTADRPSRPYGFTMQEYIDSVIAHRGWLISRLSEVDEFFDSNDLYGYISSLNFLDSDFLSVQSWMLEMFSGNPLFPDILLAGGQWRLEGFQQLFAKYNAEGINSDIKKMFKAFEIYNLNCVLEVI